MEPVVGFDWYVTGYCISHFNVEWRLSTKHASDENIDLLVKGLRSSSIVIGKIQELHIHSSCKSLNELKDFCQLCSLCLQYVIIDEDDEVMLCQLIEHQSRLRRVECRTVHDVFKYAGKGSFFSQLLGLSSVEELRIGPSNINTELLPHSNTNIKKLTFHQELIQPLATLLPNVTSLTDLKIDGPVTDSDISLHMLEVLQLKGFGCRPGLICLNW